MNQRTAASVALLVLFFASMASAQTRSPEPVANRLLGAWEMLEVRWVSAKETVSIAKAQPGIFLFTPNRYSILWTRTEKPRVAFKNLSEPTDEEIKAGFQSVVFNGGSYTITDSTVTTTALIAKVPGFEGGQQFYRYTIEGNVLRLTMFDETYPGGRKPDWAGTWQTEFVLKRAE